MKAYLEIKLKFDVTFVRLQNKFPKLLPMLLVSTYLLVNRKAYLALISLLTPSAEKYYLR